MSIIYGCVLPHPPIILKEVGQGEEEKVKKTIESYIEVSKRIAQIKPEVIIISSPHAKSYSDYFSVAKGEKGYASMENFNAPQVSFDVNYDEELSKMIDTIGKEQNFSCGTEGFSGSDFTSDHGSQVPLYFINKYYTDYKLVRVGLSGMPTKDHYKMGMIIREAVERLGRKAVFVASGDLSHCQKENGPYGFKEIGPKYDQMIMDTLGKADFLSLLKYDSNLIEDAKVCGHNSFAIMAGAFDKTEVKTKVYSHEDTFGVGYGIVDYESVKNDNSRNFYDQYLEEEKKEISVKAEKSDPYVVLARDSINYYVKTKRCLDVPSSLPKNFYKEKRGVFVSIHEFSKLRGCIGTIKPFQLNIADEIVNNAISACSQDPRFEPIAKEELPYLDITVDVLSPFEKISSKGELDPKKYGVIVIKDNREGLLLPDLKGIDTVDEQIKVAKRKARIAPEEEVELYRFETTRHL